MQGDLVPRHSAETTHYELVFRLGDGSGGAFAFECDERGGIYLGRLPELARHCLALCRKGEVDGFRVRPSVVRPSTQSYLEPASGRCGRGARVVLERLGTNRCGGCGRAYHGDGTPLADPGRGG